MVYLRARTRADAEVSGVVVDDDATEVLLAVVFPLELPLVFTCVPCIEDAAAENFRALRGVLSPFFAAR